MICLGEYSLYTWKQHVFYNSTNTDYVKFVDSTVYIFVSLLIFCIFIKVGGLLKFLTMIVDLSISSFNSVVLSCVIWISVIRFIYINFLSYWWINLLIVVKCFSLSLITLLVLKSNLSDFNVASSVLLRLFLL